MRVLKLQHFHQLELALFSALKRLFPFHAAAWHVASTSIDEMVNASTEKEQAKKMNKWRNAMLSQLTSVMLIVSSTKKAFQMCEVYDGAMPTLCQT